jgi:hypothetical protein
MEVDRPFVLADEVERTLHESSAAWEGIEVQQVDLNIGEAVLRMQAGFAVVMPLRFHPETVEGDLEQAIKQIEQMVPWCLWVIGPSSCPDDLKQRLLARGFVVEIEWEGLVLNDLSLAIPTTSHLKIEPLAWNNADAYATAIAGSSDSPYRKALLANAHRFLQISAKEVQIDVARLDGNIVGYGVLRIEANGVAYLRNAMTVPAFRHQGVYLSLVAHRLAVARVAGCHAVVLQAQSKTSAPIPIKRGFRSVCRLVGLARKRSRSAFGEM